MVPDHESDVVAILVPPDVVPGETELLIDGGNLRFVVPPEAETGDKVVFRRSQDGNSWGMQLIKKRQVPLVVPVNAEPGRTYLEVDVGDGCKLSVAVPAQARAQDMLILTQAKADENDQWHCNVVRENLASQKTTTKVPELPSLSPRVPHLDAESAYQSLAEAVVAAGGFVSQKLRRGSAPPLGILGLIAGERLEADELLCKIPKALCISAAAACATALGQHVLECRSIPSDQRRDVAHAAILAKLFHMAEDRALERSGNTAGDCFNPDPEKFASVDPDARRVWDCYADSLLHEDFSRHPCCLASDDPIAMESALEPSAEADCLVDECVRLVASHKCIVDNIPEELLGPQFDERMLVRARICLLTRAFETDGASDSLLIPVVDLFNHEPGSCTGVYFTWDKQTNEMRATASREHSPGEELFGSYGLKSNTLLFGNYGFTQAPEAEPALSYNLYPHKVHSIYKVFMPPHLADHPILLDTHELHDSLKTAVKEITSSGKDAGLFIRLACARCKVFYDCTPSMQPALEALDRARATNPALGAWWAYLRPADLALHAQDSMRVKMCEYLCLVAHLEALGGVAGNWAEDGLLEISWKLRALLVDFLSSCEVP